MNEFILKQLNSLDDQLKFLVLEQSNILIRSRQAVNICDNAIANLKQWLLKKAKLNKEEEIEFFKVIKPQFTSKLKFHHYIFTIEKHRPKGFEEMQLKYLKKELKKINAFKEINLEFYTYYSTGETYLDDKYFIRGNADINLGFDDSFYYFDKEFNTSHDHKVARIIAYDLLEVYIRNEIYNLKNNSFKNNLISNHNNIKWTDSKAALTEFLYAVHSAGSFNNGKVEIKELAEFLSAAFGVDLGDPYRTFIELKSRKEPTKYLDFIRQNLINKINNDLE